jgi:hypothetical protein
MEDTVFQGKIQGTARNVNWRQIDYGGHVLSFRVECTDKEGNVVKQVSVELKGSIVGSLNDGDTVAIRSAPQTTTGVLTPKKVKNITTNSFVKMQYSDFPFFIGSIGGSFLFLSMTCIFFIQLEVFKSQGVESSLVGAFIIAIVAAITLVAAVSCMIGPWVKKKTIDISNIPCVKMGKSVVPSVTIVVGIRIMVLLFLMSGVVYTFLDISLTYRSKLAAWLALFFLFGYGIIFFGGLSIVIWHKVKTKSIIRKALKEKTHE